MEIGKRIRKKRQAMGLTAKALAAQVGCAPSFISMVENGRLPKRTSRGKFAALKRALKVRGGATPVIRKPRGTPKKPTGSRTVQVLTLLTVLVDEIRELNALVRGIPTNGTVLRPLARPMPPKPPAADGVPVITATTEKGGLDSDRRYPWKGTAKELVA